jgi:hypothetical protein
VIVRQSSCIILDHRYVSNNDYRTAVDHQNIFVKCTSDHTMLSKQWKYDIETKRDLVRSYLITGGDQTNEPNNVPKTDRMSILESSAQLKERDDSVPSVIATRMNTITVQVAIANEFTLNTEQKFAFMIITGHSNGDNRFRAGTKPNLMQQPQYKSV